jgi:hypothetical protein
MAKFIPFHVEFQTSTFYPAGRTTEFVLAACKVFPGITDNALMEFVVGLEHQGIHICAGSLPLLLIDLQGFLDLRGYVTVVTPKRSKRANRAKRATPKRDDGPTPPMPPQPPRNPA